MSSSRMHRALYNRLTGWYIQSFYHDYSDLYWLRCFARLVPPGARVADIGCGPGQYARYFRSQGHPVLSVDLADNMLSQGRILDPGLVPVVADIRRIPFAAGAVGGVLAAYTLEHVERAEAGGVFAELARVTAPGAALALMVKVGDGFHEFQSSVARGARGYVQLWGLDDLSERVAAAGFRVVFTDAKPPVSAEEVQHERGFLLAHRT